MAEFIKSFSLFSLSLLIISAFFVDSYLILTGSIKTIDPQILLLIGNISGGIQTLAGVVVSYWFGTTNNSIDKDATIANMNANKASTDITPPK